MTEQLTTIELHKEDMKFSAGHFTIFSSTERERLHGHNFTVYVALTGAVDDNGLLADYGVFKRLIRARCDAWNEWFLLPGESPHLRIERGPGMIYALFADERIPFLEGDVMVLPVKNTSVEELARLFVEELTRDAELLTRARIHEILVKVGSGPGQWGSYRWRAA